MHLAFETPGYTRRDQATLSYNPMIGPVLARVALIAIVCGILPAFAAPEIGAPAPELKGTFFTGEPFDLAALRGKVVLVNFYSSYCKHCAYEIGNVETFYEQNRDKGFEVLIIGVDAPSDRHRVERMIGIYRLKGTMVDELTSNGFGPKFPTPTAFLIDRDGILRSRHHGGKTPLYFRETVRPLLQKSNTEN
jgi:cytochrome c biogenesis protein CcmG, thiol:disulfide interchange protein DsbE